jgi:membrane-bound lytic murein transglycosylase D
MNKGVSLTAFANNLGVSVTEIKRLNPTFKTDLAPVYEGSFVDLRVPVGKGGETGLLAAMKSVSTQKYYASTDYHKVRRGDNLYVIAKRHGTSVATLKRLNGLTNRSILYPGMRIKLPGGSGGSAPRQVAKSYDGNATTYKVRRGDNLWTIAKRFGVSVRSLKRMNNLYSSKLRIGQILKLQNSDGASNTKSTKTHYVRRGENLTRIAEKYRVSLSSLLQTNNLSTSSVLKVGTRLRIPN